LLVGVALGSGVSVGNGVGVNVSVEGTIVGAAVVGMGNGVSVGSAACSVGGTVGVTVGSGSFSVLSFPWQAANRDNATINSNSIVTRRTTFRLLLTTGPRGKFYSGLSTRLPPVYTSLRQSKNTTPVRMP
jgi:hypothetical protein